MEYLLSRLQPSLTSAEDRRRLAVLKNEEHAPLHICSDTAINRRHQNQRHKMERLARTLAPCEHFTYNCDNYFGANVERQLRDYDRKRWSHRDETRSSSGRWHRWRLDKQDDDDVGE
ncbi:uncharacterized protein PV09_00271 [Verruconis gallopava]|uniref:Uncharacterized protein n=1 Tax=Verruconis gallopava TaxID=253628 RepID=A0A0D2AS56_9PEZI|nr:uncharacterized protein PV09_00271 [Verruconis gallopava]KIW09375.1 hypothetical protein PV09_00271 [Verruconis gallopava]